MGKVFFSASIYSLPKSFDEYSNILKVIKKTKNDLLVDWLSNWSDKYDKNKDLKNINKKIDVQYFFNNTEKILKADFLIAEVSNPTVGVGYQVFYASFHKIPVLALYSNDADIKKIKKFININSHLVFLRRYNSKNLFYIVNDFLNSREILKKFNFIASEKIVRYIDWLVLENNGKSRSEVLRDLIANKLMDNDLEYQKYLYK